MKSLVSKLLIAYLIMLLAVWIAVQWDSGSNWWVSLYLFSPRWALGLPLIILVPVTLWVRPRLTGWYTVHAAVLLFLLLDFRLPLWTIGKSNSPGPRLRIVTCNLGEGPIDMQRLAAWVRRNHTQVLVVQESLPAMSQQLFQLLGWEYQQAAALAIGSSLPQRPMEIISQQTVNGYPSIVAIATAVQLHQGPAAVASSGDPAVSDAPWAEVVAVHFPTFRPAFELAQGFDLAGAVEFKKLAESYRQYAGQAESAVRAKGLPIVIAGDFNVPVESVFYRDYWSSFQNALSLRGWGRNYTKYTRFHGVRIDHVLAGSQWSILNAQAGPDLGGDHRPVAVEMQLNLPNRPIRNAQVLPPYNGNQVTLAPRGQH